MPLAYSKGVCRRKRERREGHRSFYFALRILKPESALFTIIKQFDFYLRINSLDLVDVPHRSIMVLSGLANVTRQVVVARNGLLQAAQRQSALTLRGGSRRMAGDGPMPGPPMDPVACKQREFILMGIIGSICVYWGIKGQLHLRRTRREFKQKQREAAAALKAAARK